MITVLARSARKSKRRYVGGLDLFCHDEISIRGNPREKPYLNELTVLNSFPGIRESLEKVMLAGKIVMWVKKLANVATPMPAVYSLLGQTLSLIEMEKDESRLDILNLVFKLKLLAVLGLKPRMEACVRCGDAESTAGDIRHRVRRYSLLQVFRRRRSDRVYFSSEERGLVASSDRIRLAAWNQIQFPSRKDKPSAPADLTIRLLSRASSLAGVNLAFTTLGKVK